MVALHCPVCPHVQLPLPPAAVPVPGLLRDSFCFCSGRLLVPTRHGECWGGILTGSAQQFILSSLDAEAMQPLASAMAVPLPCCSSPSWSPMALSPYRPAWLSQGFL